MTSRFLLLALCGVVFIGTPVRAESWHLPGWSARAVVEIPQPLPDASIDTAGVRVLCQGRGQPQGSDYRVLDAAGKPVPFQLLFHDGSRYSLIAFQAASP